VHARGAEDADDGIADELLDDAPIRLDPVPREPVVRAEQPVDVLGVEPLSQLRRSDDVAEQGSDDLALDRAGRRTLHRSILRPAHVGDVLDRGDLPPASSASDREVLILHFPGMVERVERGVPDEERQGPRAPRRAGDADEPPPGAVSSGPR